MNNKPIVGFCGAKTRLDVPCREKPMKNGRCRLHGGLSTGPKTQTGLARCGNWKHGRYSKMEKSRRRLIQKISKDSHQLVRSID